MTREKKEKAKFGTERGDGRKLDEMREIRAKVGVIPRADGSAMFAFGGSIAIAAVYGPKPLHPQHLQNPSKGIIRCYYDMLSFSVSERKKPGPSRRSSEISKVISWALTPVLQIDSFPNTVVDVFITIIQADASTRCSAINAASMALAHAGVPMTNLVTAVSVGFIDKKIMIDLTKEEEDVEGATDIPIAFIANSGEISLLQLDGKILPEHLKEAVKAGKKACEEIYAEQKKALKKLSEEEK